MTRDQTQSSSDRSQLDFDTADIAIKSVHLILYMICMYMGNDIRSVLVSPKLSDLEIICPM